MKLKHILMSVIMISISIAIGIAICEAVARLVLNPADYLSVKTVKDSAVGIKISPNSYGFDQWGFRNKEVPRAVEIVAVGDSHTFGNTAAVQDSWPAVLARSTGTDVYNLGLGGYGPNQYYYLLQTKAVKLHPKWIICGLYMGDDFENAFSITYGLDYWSSLRAGQWDAVDADIWREPPVWAADLRNWLSENSMTYRIAFHGPILASLIENVRFRRASIDSDPYLTTLTINEKHIREAFRPVGIANRLDQKSPQIREGMRITFHLLKEMDGVCKAEGCKLLVVIIPTKESVFSDYLEKDSSLHLHKVMMQLIMDERIAKNALVEFLTHAGILHYDTLPALKQSVENHLYAQTTRDMHPGKNGYRVIGEAVAEYLKALPK